MARFSESRLRVRYAETDQMGVVYYANYMVWMEIGRTDFCLMTGFRYSRMETDDGVMIAVAEARCRYRKPARYDDEVLIRTSLTSLKRRTMTFDYRILNAGSGNVLADGRTVHVAVGRDGRPSTIPQKQFAFLNQFLALPST